MPYKNPTKEYKRRKRLLIKMLGGCCETCGDRYGLQFHHIKTRQWIASRVNFLTRMKMYYIDACEGLIVLLCEWCNKSEGIPD